MTESLKDIEKLDLLYTHHLNKIANIDFTPREIDVLACIVHSRTDKKTAWILSISPRTVNAHVYNLMKKLGCNSKDGIIDFIEKNGASVALREYYPHLIIQSEFKKILSQIAKEINRTSITVHYDRNKATLMDTNFLQLITKDLELANIKMLPDNNISNDDINHHINLDDVQKTNYHIDILNIINNTIQYKEFTQKYIERFTKTRDSAAQMLNKDLIYNKHTHKLSQFVTKKYVLISTIVTFILSILLTIYITPPTQTSNSIQLNLDNDKEEVIQKIIQELKKYDISPNNVDKIMARRNLSVIKKIEEIINLDNDKVIPIFENTSLTNENLVEFLYYLHALACHYCFHENNGAEKAQIILFRSKNILENYVNSRTNLNLNFNKLEPQEILIQLELFQDFAEIYTNIIYMIGRSYLYAKDYDNSKIYFERSYIMGTKLKLFEGLLSNRNGKIIIQKIESEKLLKEGKIKEAKHIIRNDIKTLERLQFDRTKYTLNYKPNSDSFQIIIPAKNLVNITECGFRIIDYYSTIIEYSNSQQEIQHCLDKINFQLFGDKKFTGILDNITKINSRRAAYYYYILGKLLFTLQTKNINSKIAQNINEIMSLQDHNQLTLAEYFFNESYLMSKNNEFTKTISLSFLIETYRIRLQQENLSESEIKILQQKILNLEAKQKHLQN